MKLYIEKVVLLVKTAPSDLFTIRHKNLVFLKQAQ